jgi:hypothetical protein
VKLIIVAFLLWGVIAQASAEGQLGFIRSNAPGPSIKVDGFTMEPVQGGYLALSVPPKDIEKLLLFAAKLEPHFLILEVIERLENEARKIDPIPNPAAMPIGVFFLSTKEIFLHRHKILNRNVQPVGTYSYLNQHGEMITVLAYEGGPNREK